MALYQLAAAVLISLSSNVRNAPFQEKAQDPLPLPYQLKQEELLAGNPLAEYVEMLRLEKQFLESDFRDLYLDQRMERLTNFGDYRAALRDWGLFARDVPATLPLGKNPLAGFRADSAVKAIVEIAANRRIVMVGEEHRLQQSRSIMSDLLRALWKEGYRYLAAETFYDRTLEATQRQGYPIFDTGTWTRDPIYATALREAIALGYKLVPYEDGPLPKENPPTDPMYRDNYREEKAARHIKERILDKDPAAKVLIWSDRSHVEKSEMAGPVSESVYRPFAFQLAKLTGIDPLSITFQGGFEGPSQAQEAPIYQWANFTRPLERPTVFRSRQGAFFRAGAYDMTVFFPRTRFLYGRPDWMVGTLHRIPTPLPSSLIGKGLQLVQVRLKGEPSEAVPVDQFLLRPGQPVPYIMLPGRREYEVRVVDAAGGVRGPVTIRT